MKDDRLALRVTPEFKKQIENKAAELGLSASAFVKMVLKERLTHG